MFKKFFKTRPNKTDPQTDNSKLQPRDEIIKISIDLVQPQTEALDNIKIVGWSFSQSCQIIWVGALLDEQIVSQFEYGLPRSDVAAHFNLPEMTHCGFKGTIDLDPYAPIPEAITIRAIDVQGHMVSRQVQINVRPPQPSLNLDNETLEKNLFTPEIKPASKPSLELSASIIIPTYNRAERLEKVLESITNLEGNSVCQVIVCDDGSSDRTAKICRNFRDMLPIEYCYQEDRGFRAGQASNMGIQRAIGDILVFIGDDMLLPPGFAAAHCAVHATDETVVGVGGFKRYPVLPQDQSIEALLEEAEPDKRAELFAAGLETHPTPWEVLYSGNMSLRRTHPELYFDERFIGWGWEDIELGYRLWRSNSKFHFVEGATTLHNDDCSPRNPFRREALGLEPDYQSYLENLVRFLDKFPGDTALSEVLLPLLKKFRCDQERGVWIKDGREHDPLTVMEAIRAEMRQQKGDLV